MSFTLINHENSPGWTEKNRALGNLSNGAKTYSKAITKWYAPVFEDIFSTNQQRVLLLTVTLESKAQTFKGYDRIFVFLHECNYYKQPVIQRCRDFCNANANIKVTFIVWNEDTANELKRRGYDAEFVPMGIDLDEVLTHKNKFKAPKYDDRIIYFGNIRAQKKVFFRYFKAEAKRMGFEVDYISNDRFNGIGDKLSRDEILKTIQNYKYGAGVGICAHEMAALGLKVILYAYNARCNCPYTEQQAQYFMYRNLCSQEETKTTVPEALRKLDVMRYFTPVDIRQNREIIKSLCLKRLK